MISFRCDRQENTENWFSRCFSGREKKIKEVCRFEKGVFKTFYSFTL